MPIELPEAVAGYVTSANAHDAEASGLVMQDVPATALCST